jgi:cysteinyl-tRNA synthetase
MPLTIHNTLTRTLERFEPLSPGRVGMYTCGVTVYDFCHVGHARSALAFDVIRRYLEFSGYRVTFVRNFTDVDDKIIARAREQGVSWDTVARRFIQAFIEDMGQLGVRRADIEPKATDHIPEMLELIERLIARGLAYAVDGDVYYAVRAFAGYGKLSHRSLEDLQAGARVEVDERKHDPLDFALWKASRPGEPAWDSPWGPGRPGWHIECSAMACKYLGETFDIHAGGEDLVFPHHENEIAQSEGATGRSFARYWLHNGMVTIGGEKMSKSLGNFVTIREALARVSPEALKLLFLSANYRGPLDYTEAAVAEKAKALGGLQEFLRAVERLEAETGAAEPGGAAGSAGSDEGLGSASGVATEAFRAAMDEDFNTARATAVLFDLVREGNRLIHDAGRGAVAPAPLATLRGLSGQLRRLGQVLALDLRAGAVAVAAFSAIRLERGAEAALAELAGLAEQASLQRGPGATPGPPPGVDEGRLQAVMQELLAHREAARRGKAWAAADAIRDGLAARGIRLDDTRHATHATLEFSGDSRQLPVAVTLVRR